MTVCIAALCEDRRKIVLVSDTKFSFGGSNSADDIATKAIEIHPNWSILFAGDDVSGVPSIVASARKALEHTVNPSPDEAAKCVDDAYRARLHSEIGSQVLRPFGYTVESFLQRGKDQLTESVYSDLVDRMTRVRLSLSFIVAGFDAHRRGMIFIVDGDYSPADHTPVGFCAIGSGSSAAISTMAFYANRNLLGTHSMAEDMAYSACEAKFMAESASDVGQSTFLVVLQNQQNPLFITSPRIDEIRRIWNKDGAPRIPKGATKAISEMFFSVTDLHHMNSHDEASYAMYDKIFGKTKGKATREKITKEYKALLRSTGYRSGEPTV